MTELQEAVIDWMATGEKGISSEAMAFWLTFGKKTEWHPDTTPSDPSDLNRCLKLLQAAPGLRVRLSNMAELSPSWAKLVARWDEVEACFLNEVGLDWCKAKSAPRTYALMKEILD